MWCLLTHMTKMWCLLKHMTEMWCLLTHTRMTEMWQLLSCIIILIFRVITFWAAETPLSVLEALWNDIWNINRHIVHFQLINFYCLLFCNKIYFIYKCLASNYHRNSNLCVCMCILNDYIYLLSTNMFYTCEWSLRQSIKLE